MMSPHGILGIILLPLAAAAAGPSGEGGGAGDGGSFFVTMLPPLVLMFFVFYVLVIRPQRRKEDERQKALAAVKKNDRVVTNAGIYGTVAGTRGNDLVLRIDDQRDVKIRVLRSAIATVVPVGDETAEEKPEAAEAGAVRSEGKA